MSKVYDPEGIHVVALQELSFDISPGEFCVVVGPSGCGKTTLLNMIAGFDDLTSGEIVMDGTILTAPASAYHPAPTEWWSSSTARSFLGRRCSGT